MLKQSRRSCGRPPTCEEAPASAAALTAQELFAAARALLKGGRVQDAFLCEHVARQRAQNEGAE